MEITTEDVAKAVGRTRRTILHWIKEEGLEARPPLMGADKKGYRLRVRNVKRWLDEKDGTGETGKAFEAWVRANKRTA